MWKQQIRKIVITATFVAASVAAGYGLFMLSRWCVGLLPLAWIWPHRTVIAFLVFSPVWATLLVVAFRWALFLFFVETGLLYRAIIFSLTQGSILQTIVNPNRALRQWGKHLSDRLREPDMSVGILPQRPSPRPGVLAGIPSFDAVHFTITAPLTVAPQSTFELMFWAHTDEQRDQVFERAQQIISGGAVARIFVHSEGPYKLQHGAELTIRMSISGFKIETTHKPLLWVGEISNAGFIVSVPANAQPGQHAGRASIRLDGMQIATVGFLLTVGPAAESVGIAPTYETQIHKTAFASYASEDRNQVVARVQGMEAAAKHLKVFVDVVDLRSGQFWEQELWNRIPKSDILYLFWCRHAKESPWVEKEWRCALEKRGLDFIDPVPLEPPDLAPPPPELSSKHFNDPLLAFMKGSHTQA